MKKDTSDLYELNIHPFICQLDFVTPHFLSTQFGEKRWRENVFYIKCGTLMRSCVNHAYSLKTLFKCTTTNESIY